MFLLSERQGKIKYSHNLFAFSVLKIINIFNSIYFLN